MFHGLYAMGRGEKKSPKDSITPAMKFGES